MTDEERREELLRLREENLRLREERLETRGKPTPAPPTEPPVINVKQVNEGWLSGCAGLVGVFFVIVWLLGKCTT